MDKVVLTLYPFVVGTEVDAANKVLEEASEAREAARRVRECCDSVSALGCAPDTYPNVKQIDCMLYVRLANEIAETIQAACNLAAFEFLGLTHTALCRLPSLPVGTKRLGCSLYASQSISSLWLR